MVTIRRPLLLFGASRPACLLTQQLRSVRVAALICFGLICAGLAYLYLFDSSRMVVTVVRIWMLLLAAGPGILLEYYLERNARSAKDTDASQLTATLYSTELLQFLFLLNLAVFLG